MVTIIDNPLKLVYGFQEFRHRFLIFDVFGDEMPTAQGREITLLCHALLGRLGEKEINRVMEVRSLIEMSLRSTSQKTEFSLIEFGSIIFLDKPILLMHDAVIREHLNRLMPSRVHRFIFALCHGEEFGKFQLKGNSQVCILAHKATIFHRQKRKLGFERTYFAGVAHLLSMFKITNQVIDRTAVNKIARMHTNSPLLHQSILTILAVHGKRLPHNKRGTH